MTASLPRGLALVAGFVGAALLLPMTTRAATIYAVTQGGTFLVRFDSSTPGTIDAAVLITGLQSGERIAGIDFRPRTGQLYGIGVTSGAQDAVRTYVIDPHTGAATLLPGSAPFTVTAGTHYGIGFNPTVDRIRVVNSGDENFRVNPNNGARADAPTGDTDLNPTARFVCGVAYDRQYDTGFAVANRTTLYAISNALDSLVTIGGINQSPSPNGGAVNTVGALGITIGTEDAGFDVTPSGTAFAAFSFGSGSNNLFSINLATGAATLIGAIGNGSLEIGGIATVPPSVLVFGTEKKVEPRVRAVDASTGIEQFDFAPFPVDEKIGVRVALGDLTLDGVPDIVCGMGKGGQLVRVFDGSSGAAISLFNALEPFEAGYAGGVFVASGDVNGDGNKDVIVGRGKGPNSAVRVFSGANGAVIAEFTPYDAASKAGVYVAAADLDRDGDYEIVTGPTKGSPQVRVFDGAGAPFTSASLPAFKNQFPAYPAKFKGGVSVAVGDVNGDGVPDIVTGAGAGDKPQVAVFSGVDTTEIGRFVPFSKNDRDGVRVAVGDVDFDGRFDIVATLGAGAKTEVVAFDGVTFEEKSSFVPFETKTTKGAFVGGVRR